MYVGGTVTATLFSGSFSGSISPTNTSTLAVGFAVTAGQLLPANTGSQYVGYANEANNLLGGAAGSLPYQTGSGATAFLAGGTQGQFLRYGPSNAPIWSSTGTFSGGTASTSSAISQSVTVTGGLGVAGNSDFVNDVNVGGTLYAGNLATSGTVVGGGVRTTSSATPPASPTVGDIWYATGTDDIYRYTTDGTSSFWLDINGPAIANSTAGLVIKSALQAAISTCTTVSDIKNAIANL